MLHKLVSLAAALLLVLILPVQPLAEAPGLTPPSLYAETAILIDADSGQMLYGKNPHKQMYPASITKIMTCLLAMERGNPSDTVTVTDEGVFAVPRGTTHIALTGGEELPLEQLEYAMMVQSANDAANAIAIHLGGSITDFAGMMNAKASEIGAKDTHFTNANGLPDPGHYTSAYDMALITRTALGYPEFRSLAGTPAYELPPTNKQPETRYLKNGQYMFTLGDTYPGAFAGKTGWTEEAGHTLVTIAERDGVTLISVVMHSDGAVDAQFKDSTALLDYGYDNFRRVTVTAGAIPAQRVSYADAQGQTVEATLKMDKDLYILLPDGMAGADVAAKLDIPEPVTEDSISRAQVHLILKNVPQGMGEDAGSYPFAIELQQAVPVDSPEAEEIPFWKLLVQFSAMGAGTLILMLVLIRQMMMNQYRKRKRMREIERAEAQRALERRRRRSASRQAAMVIDVTKDERRKNRIKVIDTKDL